MAERGAVPQVPVLQRRALKAIRGLFTPLLPDDYLELINPLWSTQELRGRIERVQRETDDAVTVFIKPGWEWPGHSHPGLMKIVAASAVSRSTRSIRPRSSWVDQSGLISSR